MTQTDVCTPVYAIGRCSGYRAGMASEVGDSSDEGRCGGHRASGWRRRTRGDHHGGRPVAQLGPLGAVEGQVRLTDLVARGLVIPPRRTGPYQPAEPVTVWSGARIDRLLREIR